MFMDNGQLAAALGYDAISYGRGPLPTRNFIILNRGALAIEQDPVLKISEVRALSPQALREYAATRGVTIPAGARKSEIVSALTDPRVAAQ
jgi:hypothetical protein